MFRSIVTLITLSLGIVAVSAAPAGNSTLSTRTVNSPKGVYAHFMVGNSFSATVASWTTNIQLAQASGIDGFALNAGNNDWQPTQVANAYQAASNLDSGFKLFLSLDMSYVIYYLVSSTLLTTWLPEGHCHVLLLATLLLFEIISIHTLVIRTSSTITTSSFCLHSLARIVFSDKVGSQSFRDNEDWTIYFQTISTMAGISLSATEPSPQ